MKSSPVNSGAENLMGRTMKAIDNHTRQVATLMTSWNTGSAYQNREKVQW